MVELVAVVVLSVGIVRKTMFRQVMLEMGRVRLHAGVPVSVCLCLSLLFFIFLLSH